MTVHRSARTHGPTSRLQDSMKDRSDTRASPSQSPPISESMDDGRQHFTCSLNVPQDVHICTFGPFGPSTAERMRNAVDAAFGPLESVDIDDNKSHWRLRSDALRRLVSISAGELTELGSAATVLERAGLDERAAMLRDLATKLRATMRAESPARPFATTRGAAPFITTTAGIIASTAAPVRLSDDEGAM